MVTDAVFSVDGDLAPLQALHAAVRAHGALLVIDEAHALGVVGDHGRGAAHAYRLRTRRDPHTHPVEVPRVPGRRGPRRPEVIETLIDTGRSFIFDTGLNPPAAHAALAALDVLESDPGLPSRARDRALRIAKPRGRFRPGDRRPGRRRRPRLLGEPHAALRAAEICAEHGLRVGCFRPPSVPKGRACLRLTARATLDEADLTRLREALAEVACSTGRSLHA